MNTVTLFDHDPFKPAEAKNYSVNFILSEHVREIKRELYSRFEKISIKLNKAADKRVGGFKAYNEDETYLARQIITNVKCSSLDEAKHITNDWAELFYKEHPNTDFKISVCHQYVARQTSFFDSAPIKEEHWATLQEKIKHLAKTEYVKTSLCLHERNGQTAVLLSTFSHRSNSLQHVFTDWVNLFHKSATINFIAPEPPYNTMTTYSRAQYLETLLMQMCPPKHNSVKCKI